MCFYNYDRCCTCYHVPLLSELGTCKTVKARFWPWLEPFSAQTSLNTFGVVTSTLGNGSDKQTQWRYTREDSEALRRPWTASKQRKNYLKGFKDFSPESQGHNLALTVLYVPNLLESRPIQVVQWVGVSSEKVEG